jgi:tetratricopeptide (TPR) repeat protein
MYERAVAADPHFALAYARLAWNHARVHWLFFDRSAGRLDDAKRMVDRALALDPDHPEVRIALGYYHYLGHLEYDLALAEFLRAGRAQPNHADLFEALGNVRRRQGAFEDAVAHFGSAFVRSPRSPMVAFILGQTLALAGDAAQAEDYFDRAAQLEPGFVQAYWNKARLYLNAEGSTEKARAALESGRAFGGDPALVYHAVLVDVFERRYEDALERVGAEAREAFESQWSFVPASGLRAEIHELMQGPGAGRMLYDSARLVAEQRVRAQPDEANYRSALGIAFAGLQRSDEAIGEALRAVELLPVTKEAWRGLYRLEDLARVYVMVGEDAAALDTLERLVSLPGGKSIPFLRLDPVWDPLREHPRFQALLGETRGRPPQPTSPPVGRSQASSRPRSTPPTLRSERSRPTGAPAGPAPGSTSPTSSVANTSASSRSTTTSGPSPSVPSPSAGSTSVGASS